MLARVSLLLLLLLHTIRLVVAAARAVGRIRLPGREAEAGPPLRLRDLYITMILPRRSRAPRGASRFDLLDTRTGGGPTPPPPPPPVYQ